MHHLYSMPETKIIQTCHHCGLDCEEQEIHESGHVFCCEGCATVYQILESNDLGNYYQLNTSPGSRKNQAHNYDFLEDETIQSKLVKFKDDTIEKVVFELPQIHCVSCVWLLENLYKLNPSIVHSRVNYLRKEISISYKRGDFTLKECVELLDSIGYAPTINLKSIESEGTATKHKSKKLLYQIGIAGFAFGNVMFLSLPEYFDVSLYLEGFKEFIGVLNILLTLPVLLYSAQDYFKNAWVGLKHKNDQPGCTYRNWNVRPFGVLLYLK